MKFRKEIFTHFGFVFSFFALITIFRKWFDLYYIPFWLGGILGTVMPYIDHLLYIYVLKPSEPNSQRIAGMIERRDVKRAFTSLVEGRYQESVLIFHKVEFQLIFLLFTFFVISSSGSVFGKGIVLAFSLHLFIDQMIDLVETGELEVWFKGLPFGLDKERRRWYLVFVFLIILVLGLLM